MLLGHIALTPYKCMWCDNWAPRTFQSCLPLLCGWAAAPWAEWSTPHTHSNLRTHSRFCAPPATPFNMSAPWSGTCLLGFFLQLSPGKLGIHPMPQIQGVRLRGWWGREGAGPQGSPRPEGPYAIRWGLGVGLEKPRKVKS